MKKLTENWKVKKGHLRNKTFRDSIDYSFSNIPKNENKQNQSKILKRNCLNKTSFLNLDITSVIASEENDSTPPRRSSRLKEKSNSVKHVETKAANFDKDEINFSFSDSFGFTMANEVSKYEKPSVSNTSNYTDSHVVEKLNGVTHNLQTSKKENVLQKVKCVASALETNKNVKSKEIPPLSPSDKIATHEIRVNSQRNVQKKLINAITSKSKCTEDLSQEMKAEKTPGKDCNADSSLDSKNNSALNEEDCLDLAYWGLPSQVISAYRSRNINKMFQWQYECLSMKNILNGKNLVYSAPTSAGKTLVAEILMLKKVLESKKKAMMILPFVSVVREKVNYLQEMFQDTGVVVGGYMGAYRPPGGFRATDISICTIEKANNLINRLMEERRLDELGILVVDELHMLGDTSRGYLLELLLTKLLYNCKRNAIDLQIIGMSATLPNLNVLSFWLDAELYHTDFRPVPLHEMYKVGPAVYDSKTHKLLRDLAKDSITFANDSDHTISLTIETVASGTGVLVFCPSKNWCETLATSIAREIFNTGKPTQEGHKNPKLNYIGQQLREHINGSALGDILLQLKNSPAGIDSVLKLTVPFGVAFHHAGLTYDERDIIEGAFKQGILKVLVATTTLSSGVNLPARRVLIRSPLFCGAVIDTLSYKQMVGRAGRKGIDNQGESILICKETERKSALQLVGSDLQPVKSCLMKSGKDGLHSSLKRAIIEVIASGAAVTHEEVIQYASCTLLFASLVHEANQGNPTENSVEVSINKCLDYLLDNDFIFKIEKKSDDTTIISYKPSQLGSAILSSGFSPEDSLRILKELQLARRSFVLENDLHILYEVTPPYLSDQMGSINWMNFLSIWEQLPEDYRRVGELVGVKESFIGLGIQGKIKMGSAQTYHKLAVHQRFYAALALNELIQEVPLAVVAEKYNCNKGILQSLQQTTSTFSGMLTIFCNRLGWHNLELLFSHFQKRVHFGIQQELCDLIQLSTLNAQRARVLYNAGYETISSLATADPSELELVLCNAGAFESEKQLDGEVAEEAMKRREVKRIRITGKQGVNEREAAILIIDEARNFIKYELGIKTISWKSSEENLLKMKNAGEADIPNKAIDTSSVRKSVIGESSSKQKINPQNDKIIEVICQNENVCEVGNNKSADAKHLLTTEKSKTNLLSEKIKPLLAIENSKIYPSNESITPLLSVEKSKTNSSSESAKFLLATEKTKTNSSRESAKSLLSTENTKINSSSQSIKPLLATQKSKNNSFSKCVKSEDLIITDQNSETIFFNSGNSEKNILSENKSESQNNESTQKAGHLDVRKHPVSETLNSALNQSCKKQSNIDVIIRISQTDKEGRDLKYELNSVNIPQNDICTTSNKNETYFFTEEVSNLFVELEKTINDQTNNESSFFADTKVCIPIAENDLSTSQLLLSQSAELEDVYHGQSFLNAGLQNLSFSGYADNQPQNILSNSIIEEMNNKFTSKKTRDTLDALFDSPISENGSFLKEDIVVYNHETTNHKKSHLHMSNVEAIFDSSNFDNTVTHKDSKMKFNCSLNKCSLEKSITSKNTKEAVKKSIKRKNTIFEHFENENDIVHASPLDAFTLNKKIIAQSTPNAACIAMLDNNLPKTDPKMHDSRKSDSSHKSETSQDLFGESLDGDLLNQAQLLDIVSDKLENTPENNVQCVSSCSDDIFGSDKSFEKMLGDHCAENDISKLSNVQPKNNQKKRSFTESNEDCEADEKKLLSTKNSNESQSSIIAKKLLLENSGDLFEEAADSEPVFKDPKKQLSFEFDDNSEIFKTWNPSPNRSKLLNSVTKEEVKNNKIESPKQSNLNCKQNESFLANLSDFSSFSSDCLEDTPPEKLNSTKTVLLQSSVYKRKFSINQDIVKDDKRDKVFKTQNFHLKKSELSFSPTDIILEKSIPADDKMKFDIVDVVNENFDYFFKLLQNASIFGLSVACEKIECKNAVNIGPPKLREKKKPSAEILYINDEIFVAGLSFCFNGKVYYMKFPSSLNNGITNGHLSDVQSKLRSLQQLFQSFSCKVIIAYDIKSYYKVLWKGCNIVLSQNKDISYLDPSVAAWLLDPSDGQQSLQGLVSNYWSDASHIIDGFDRSQGSLGLQHWSSISGQLRAVTESYISFHLIKILANQLKVKKLFKSFVDIEMPSILTLAKMERMGLGFDLKLAMDNRKELQKKQEVLMKKAYQLAGRSFNIMSSKDLSRILYKELRLSALDSNTSPMASRHLGLGMTTRGSAKKLPPELKTNKECLEKIMHLHPLPKTIMDWRKLSFALSKVLMPLLRENKFDKDFNMHRIYSTCYVYTVTGRINMHTPNLQFVPRDFNVHGADSDENGNSECYQIDDEISLYGVSLRNMFIPSEGNVLLSADYSQLELRILAHLSGDAKLLKSLNSGDDIFRQIAATWKNIFVSSVTDEIRQQAKKICYGIIYGMSAKSLAHQLKTSENEAANFMETFKKSYPGVTHYLNSVVESCRNKGYVTTIMERRRYLSHILSENKAERAHAERQAINTTIQGSAADIIKKATIEIDRKLKVLFSKESEFTTNKKGTESSRNCCRGGFLVLQLHDELMYEVFKSDLDAVKNIVKTVMESTTKLSVILPVNIKVGTSWGSMEEIL